MGWSEPELSFGAAGQAPQEPKPNANAPLCSFLPPGCSCHRSPGPSPHVVSVSPHHSHPRSPEAQVSVACMRGYHALSTCRVPAVVLRTLSRHLTECSQSHGAETTAHSVLRKRKLRTERASRLPEDTQLARGDPSFHNFAEPLVVS